jgi:polyisoprenyl-phosphate glycosyltransferase
MARGLDCSHARAASVHTEIRLITQGYVQDTGRDQGVLASRRVSDGVRISIAMPVYNDWESAAILCGHLERELARRPERFSIVLIDDGSTTPPPEHRPQPGSGRPIDVSVLELTRNLGHQRAIAVALAYIHEHLAADAVVVMDADGEDRAEDVPRLLDALHETGAGRVVFAQRRRRVEGMQFRAGYLIYRILHRAMTGFSVQVGNFSVVPARHVANLTVSPELWAHYAAAVYAARLPVHLVPADRGRRIAGRSHMNYAMLVTHGLGALSVFRHRVGGRLLLAMSTLVVALGGALAAGVALAAARGQPPSLAMIALFALLIANIAVTGFGVAFGMFAERQELGFVPSRDYRFFVRGFKRMNEPRAVPVSGR